MQVGAGGMGRAWLGTVAADPDVELVGVVDLDLDAARAGAELAGAPTIPVGRDLPALLAETGAEAVLDITVPVAHHPVTMDALHAGLPVLGEKPAAQTVAEALSLAAAAEATGQLFMVSQSRRYNDQLVAFRQHVRALGGVGSLNTRFAKAPHFGGFREEMDDVLLLDMAIHAFDSARYVLERDPVSVYCESWNPSWSWYRGDANAAAVFTFEDDVRYVYDGSWCAPGDETSWNGDWRATERRARPRGTATTTPRASSTTHPAPPQRPPVSAPRSPGRSRPSCGRSGRAAPRTARCTATS